MTVQRRFIYQSSYFPQYFLIKMSSLFIRSKTGILDDTSFKYFSLVGFTCLMRRIFNGDRSQNISRTPYKLLNILMYRSPFCIIIHYRSYKVTKMFVFLGHLVYVSCVQTYSYSIVLCQVFYTFSERKGT